MCIYLKKVVKCCFILQLTQGQEHPLSHFITNHIKSNGQSSDIYWYLISVHIYRYLMIFVDLWSHEASWRGQSQAGTELHSAAVGRTCDSWQHSMVVELKKVTRDIPGLSGYVWKCWVYSQWNSHLVGIMISKTIGCRGLAYFQTNPSLIQSYQVRMEYWPSEASLRALCASLLKAATEQAFVASVLRLGGCCLKRVSRTSLALVKHLRGQK